MAASERSLRLTDSYRSRLLALRDRADTVAANAWREIDLSDLEATFENWLGATSTAVADAQLQATRLSATYLTAYVSSEVGHRVPTVSIDARAYAGTARDGRSLAEAYDTARIAVLVALRDGKSNEEALEAGKVRALRAVELDVMQTARQSLTDAQRAHPMVEGHQRAVSGTCGACLAASEPAGDNEDFETHPGCQCIPEPRVKGVLDAAPRLVGAALFKSMSRVEQDDALGEETAELVRTGQVAMGDLVKRNRMKTETDFITQVPVKALT